MIYLISWKKKKKKKKKILGVIVQLEKYWHKFKKGNVVKMCSQKQQKKKIETKKVRSICAKKKYATAKG